MIVESVNIFVNPIAGRGRGRQIADRLERQLRADGYLIRTSFEPPESLSADAVSGPIRAAIVIGGDGTLRAVADRLIELRGDDVPPMLPVPLGTANLMSRHLKLKWRDARLESEVSAAIRALHVVKIDAWRANGRLFLLMAGIGYDGAVVHELRRVRTGPIRMHSYLIPAFRSLWHYKFPPFRVTVDGKQIWNDGPAIAFVANVREYGAGFPILPDANSSDGLLDICVLPASSRVGMFRLFFAASMGRHLRIPGVLCVRGRSVRFDADVPVPIQLDGDAAGFTPLDISLLPMQLPFIVPGGVSWTKFSKPISTP